MSGHAVHRFVSHRGLKFPISYSPENIDFAIDYKPSDSDIFVVTYPKCGTTWTQQIVHLILNDGQPIDDKNFINSSCLEYKGAKCSVKAKQTIKTHLPFNLLPYNPNAKYIYVIRNPKDTCVSYFNHLKALFEYDFHRFFDFFISGQLPYGDYFEHLDSFASHRSDANVCLLVYEQMVADPRRAIMKVADFLGHNHTDKLLAYNEELLRKVINNSSFESMKNELKDNQFIFGKGVVGQWRHFLSKHESLIIDHKFNTYFSGTDLEPLWQQIMKMN